MTEEEDYFGWTDASDADGIPSTDDDFAQIDNMPQGMTIYKSTNCRTI